MTPAARAFLHILQERIALFERKLDTAPDAYARGLYAGWKTATEEALREAATFLPDVENEAKEQEERRQVYMAEEATTGYVGVPE